ncbi:MAG: fasciclin domain-containing protein [Parachlamydiales bacterium]|jgi:uncharacterized surface protein with fasciclin (FAS1) repeats
MNKIILGFIALAAVVLAFSLGGLKAGSGDQNTDTLTLLEITSADPSFSTFVSALKASGFDEKLKGSKDFTIFAPSNDAFAKLPAGVLQTLLKPQNKDKLKEVISYHIIPGKIEGEQLHSSIVGTLSGKKINLKVNGSNINVNNAKVVKSDIKASNGVIYVLDTVLVPQPH